MGTSSEQSFSLSMKRKRRGTYLWDYSYRKSPSPKFPLLRQGAKSELDTHCLKMEEVKVPYSGTGGQDPAGER